jgi:ferric-dicitrate binding protein FerR (iron transport regulator)
MQPTSKELTNLMLRSLMGDVSEEEKAFLDNFSASSPRNRELLDKIRTGIINQDDYAMFDDGVLDSESVRIKIESEIGSGKRKGSVRRFLYAAAAILILAAGSYTGYWFLHLSKASTAGDPALTIATGKIVPGSNNATLTLADGNIIDLNSAGNGQIAAETGIAIQKNKDGQLVYLLKSADPGKNVPGIKAGTNTISTPKGGQYQVVLSDGTIVWLNAASSLTFPTVFPASGRSVTLTGEGYFEVAKRSSPFQISSRDIDVAVLGTSLNIKSYPNEEASKATLISGAVKVTAKGQEGSIVLKPGEELTGKANDKLSINRTANVYGAIAWKSGFFYFNRTGLKDIMRQIERWYNVEVVYQGSVNTDDFTGEIPKSASIEDVLEILKTLDVKFTIKGKQIIVAN